MSVYAYVNVSTNNDSTKSKLTLNQSPPFKKTDLKGNISRRFSSQDIVASFSIFDSSNLPQNDSPDLSSYGEEFFGVLEDHYGKELAAESIEGEEFIVSALVSPDTRTECITFRGTSLGSLRKTP